MAEWLTTGSFNAYHNYNVWLKYTTSYDETTNQTTVTISGWDMSWDYMMTVYYETNGTFTIAATDNPTSSDTYGVWYGQSRNPGSGRTSGGDAKTIVVQHGRGTDKNITISWSGYAQVGGQYKATWTDNTTVSAGAATEYHLSINQTNCSVIVSLNDSEIAAGTPLYYGDVLKISYNVETGYGITSALLNDESIANGATHTVSGNVTISIVTTVLSFNLTITQGDGTRITVKRTSSPKASAALEVLATGDIVYYDDVLNITFNVDFGYDILTHTVNGDNFISGNDYIVHQDLAIVATAERTGLIYIDNGSGWDAYEIWIDNGTTWDLYIPYVDDGTNWQQFG